MAGEIVMERSDTVVDLVLGGDPDRQSNAGNVGRPTSAELAVRAMKNGLRHPRKPRAGMVRPSVTRSAAS